MENVTVTNLLHRNHREKKTRLIADCINQDPCLDWNRANHTRWVQFFFNADAEIVPTQSSCANEKRKKHTKTIVKSTINNNLYSYGVKKGNEKMLTRSNPWDQWLNWRQCNSYSSKNHPSFMHTPFDTSATTFIRIIEYANNYIDIMLWIIIMRIIAILYYCYHNASHYFKIEIFFQYENHPIIV